ncbi:MAG: hypothetical protein RSE41_02400 [Clostridia bacterium]
MHCAELLKKRQETLDEDIIKLAQNILNNIIFEKIEQKIHSKYYIIDMPYCEMTNDVHLKAEALIKEVLLDLGYHSFFCYKCEIIRCIYIFTEKPNIFKKFYLKYLS